MSTYKTKNWVPAALLVLLVGCGYQLVGRQTHLPPGIKSIAIPPFSNNTFEPGIEIPLTNAFLTTFIRDRRIDLTTPEYADAVVEGVIKSFSLQSSTYDPSGLVVEYQTTMVVDVVLRRRDGQVLWQENGLTETRWFRTSSSIPHAEANKLQAIQEIGSLMAERIQNRFFYNF